jgi:DNA-binding CsgD family transcriptional regulator
LVVAVIGREAELERIGAFFDSEQGAKALWLEGVAGIGKTTLWRAGIELGHERAWRVLSCVPTASETAFSFAALGDLVAPVVEEVLPRLPPPQRSALGVALALVEDEAPNADERVVGLALLSSLRLLAARDPVLVAVDDVQWLDPASAAALRFAARRLEHENVKLLLSARIETGAPPPQLDRELADGLLRIGVGPLSSSELHHIVVARFGQSLSRPTLLRVHEASAGNPFHALEIARFLLEEGTAPGPGEPLPVPRTLEEVLHARIMRLPRATRDVLELTALLSEPTIEMLENAGSEPELLDPAIAVGVIDPIDDRVLFTHPLLAAAVVSTIEPRRRRRLHARLAGLELDPEERAKHLALATDGPDAVVANMLEEASQHAVLRGAPASAAELAELAARRTPREDREGRWRRLNEGGLRHATAGDLPRARALLGPLVDDTPPGPFRARVLMNLADTLWDDNAAMISLAERALAEIGDDDASRARLHSLLGEYDWDGGVAGMLDHLRAALAAAERVGDEEQRVLALVHIVRKEAIIGRMTPGLLEQALGLADATGRLLARVPEFENPGTQLGTALLCLNRFEEARALLERSRADSLLQGAYPAAQFASPALTELMCVLGDLQSAGAYAADFVELGDQLGLDEPMPWSLYATALVDAHLGNVDEARAAASRGVAIAADTGPPGVEPLNQGVLGFVELSLGNAAAAVDFLRPAARSLEQAEWREPCAGLKPNAIEALIAVGELDEAAGLLADLEDWSQAVAARATLAACLRCRGLLSAAHGDHEAAFAAFGGALEAYERLPTPFDRARTLLALGALQRRTKQRRAARESLGTALTVFEELGARLWAEKASSELTQLGGRRAQDGRLTPTESQIASLVAQGRTNQQVADALFISPKTVEWNLSKVYRKLQVRSRSELAAKLARQVQEPGGSIPGKPPGPQ